ncbi:hypothetical protein [Halomonas sp. ML-15]|uniref:hypothetical protein n=1 Tax=Halomonas sp. ML-15 TaxID=2773305 RepID=UPI001CD0FB09|nr:hypothetical protein [Halomonas sp. ML-15]
MRHNNKMRYAVPRSVLASLAVGLLFAAPLAMANDYPTSTRVDYVLGCMAANGQNHLVLQQCSCSIDVIADLIPYDEYESVETVMRMNDQRGELGVLFRTERGLQDQVRQFRSAQAEADLRCF